MSTRAWTWYQARRQDVEIIEEKGISCWKKRCMLTLQGIITVTTGDISVKDVEVDEDLKALNDIPRVIKLDVQMIIFIQQIRKHHDDPNPFDLGSIISVLSINPNTRGVDSKIRLEQAGIDSDALYNAMFVYQEHLKSCSQEIGNEQSDIYEQMHSTNALSGKMLGLMKARVERAQMEQEQLQGSRSRYP